MYLSRCLHSACVRLRMLDRACVRSEARSMSFLWLLHAGCPKKTGTPHKMVSICRYIYSILSIGLYCRIGNAILHNYIKSKWLFQNSNFTNITQKSICTGFGWSTIVNANTIAWHLLQINPFNTKVSAAKHTYVLNLGMCYPKIKNETIFSYIIFWIMLMNAMPIFYRKWPLPASGNQCPWKQYENKWYSLP